MIRYEWCTSLSADDTAALRSLLNRAASYDAEPEYNTIDADALAADLADPASGVRHLVVWLTPRPVALDAPLEPERVAGVIRLVPSGGGWADGTIVIDPDLRSLGIVTLLLEQEGVDVGADGWLGSGFVGIRSWARGNHPASGRIADRNLLPRTKRVWKLVRPTDEYEDGDAERVVVLASDDQPALSGFLATLGASAAETARVARGSGQSAQRRTLAVRSSASGLSAVADLDLTPVHVDEFGRCATIDYLGVDPALDGEAKRKVLSQVLIGAGAYAREAGLDGVVGYVESTDDALVAAARRTGFQHDRTDVLYEIR
ncbi:N-acetyltransferase [Gordonia sp. TBRC 11910]|uniref:N-acetyltransferase n=1 Tax=Gordonia asplenii TaxID=2725283 RepID=A0A848L3R3_9ACTN|nr:N-acetyltransferase [Gordonia asplenii]NMO03695.1 N-acetyltransferase [Gordonia asplenii]